MVVAGAIVLAACGAASAGTAATVATFETAPVLVAATTTDVATDVTAQPAPVAVTTAVATSTTPPPPPTTIPAPCNVIFVSDSVGIDLINNGLKDRLAFGGCSLKWTGGQRGIEIESGAKVLSGASGVDANVVVVMLGYHNANSNAHKGRFPAVIDLVMQAAGSRLVVWPMYGATDDCSANYQEGVGIANQALQDATGRWPNLRLVDYTSLLAAHPEYSQHRCPHLLASGSHDVAGWLAGQIREVANVYYAAAG